MGFALAVIFWIVATSHAVGTIIFRWRALHFKAAVPLVLYLLVPLILWVQLQYGISLSAHRDAVLIENFTQFEPELLELAEMFADDQFVTWLCPDGSGLWRNEAAKPSTERLSRYKVLFETAGIRYGVSRRFHGQIRLRYWAVGGDVNFEKGYAYLTSPPEPLVELLDGSQGRLAFRHLSGSWYLYFSDTDSIHQPCT